MYSFRIISHGEGSTKSDPSEPSEPIIIPPTTPQSPKLSMFSRTSLSSMSIPEDVTDSASVKFGGRGETDFHKKYIELDDIERGTIKLSELLSAALHLDMQ